MGLKTIDVSPIATNGPTASSPPGKEVKVKAFSVARTNTTAKLGAVLKANASIIDFVIYGAASNAGTTAVLSIGSTSANSNEYVDAQDVKTAGGVVRPTSTMSTSLPNLEPLPLAGDLAIYAKYAETGGASSSGGPWTVLVHYIE